MNKFKRILSIILVMCLALSLLPGAASAADATSGVCGDNLTWTLDSSGVLTISGIGPMKDFDGEYGQSKTLLPWYDQRKTITSVIIEDGVTRIGNDAFGNCSYLASVSIPDSVTSIGERAFLRCKALTSVSLPNGVTTIGSSAFNTCSALTKINIPEKLTTIGLDVFQDCTALKNVVIPDGVTSIGQRAFANCSSLKSVTIPESVAAIKDSAFYKCDSLSDVYYSGSEAQWNAITFLGDYENFSSATIHFNGEQSTSANDQTTEQQEQNDKFFLCKLCLKRKLRCMGQKLCAPPVRHLVEREVDFFMNLRESSRIVK